MQGKIRGLDSSLKHSADMEMQCPYISAQAPMLDVRDKFGQVKKSEAGPKIWLSS